MSHVDVAIHHPIKSAEAGETIGAPLSFYYGDRDAGTRVLFFVEDHDLAERIAAAVNQAIADHANQPKEEALAS